MLGLDNPIHLMFLFAILLLLFGAKRLPEIGSSLGAGLRGFKDSIARDSTDPRDSARAQLQTPPAAPVAANAAAATTETPAPVAR